jgi:hypothetical protein
MSVAKGVAEVILARVSADKAFYFYSEIGRPLGTFASSLEEFGEKLKKVETKSLEFHTRRGDFEKWVYMLGDGELAKSLIKVRDANFSGEKLRTELVRTVQTRVRQLKKPAPK